MKVDIASVCMVSANTFVLCLILNVLLAFNSPELLWLGVTLTVIAQIPSLILFIKHSNTTRSSLEELDDVLV